MRTDPNDFKPVELTTNEEQDGEPTLPLAHVLHVADEMAEYAEWNANELTN